MNKQSITAWVIIGVLAAGAFICVGTALTFLVNKRARQGTFGATWDRSTYQGIDPQAITTEQLAAALSERHASHPAEQQAAVRTPATSEEAGSGRKVDFAGDGSIGIACVGQDNPNVYAVAWKEVGPAQGKITIPAGHLLRLNASREAQSLAVLSQLGPDDLQFLDLTGSAITDRSLSAIKNLTGLRYLDLKNTSVTDKGLAYLENLNQLQALIIANDDIDDAGLTHVAKLRALSYLYSAGTGIAGPGLVKLNALKNLAVLDLSKTQVSDRDMKILASLPGLRVLMLDHDRITDAGLDVLIHQPRLDSLFLAGSQVTGRNLGTPVCHFSNLFLNDTKVDNSGLAAIGNQASLSSLNLNGTRITDKGLESLNKLERLNWLDLGSTRVTDAGVRKLSGLRTLRYLRLPVKVSEGGINSIQSAIPGCKVTKDVLEH